MTYVVKNLGKILMAIEIQVEAFQLSKFLENMAKLVKDNFKRGLIMTFKVKNL